MTPDRHQQIGELYHRLLALPRDQRLAVLDEACREDDELRREVDSLLRAHDEAGSFMDTPALDVSARLLAADSRQVPTQIGRYHVLSLIGRGGMGEVYLAEDPALGRKIAIKLLPPPLTMDAQALTRFEQEARAASSLNHPNIVTIHEIGEFEAGRFIAMEFVDGHSLSTVVGTPMPPDRLIPVARQLAQALAVAHEAGIVHRDIKPANIVLRPDGYAKLLDFGIARLVSSSTEATAGGVHAFATRAGAVIGTPRYMSPEQIRGGPATAASDVFALGAVLHELLTGRHASDPLHTTVTLDGRHGVLFDLIRRMLDPNPALRPRSAEVEAALGQANSAPAEDGGRRRWLIAAAALVALAVTVAMLSWRGSRSAFEAIANADSVRFQIVPPVNTAFSPSSASLALSPDGKTLAFTASQANQQGMALWVHSFASGKATPLPGAKTAGQLFWLPDSQSVAFADTLARFSLKVIDIRSGAVRPIEHVVLASAGVGSASPGGMLVKREGVDVIDHAGRDGESPVPATRLDASRGETAHAFPAFLPDGRHFLFVTRSSQPTHDGMAFVGLVGSDEVRPLFKSDSQVVYAQPGFLLYMLGNTLLARSFDAASLRVTGEPLAVADQVERNSGSRRGAFTVSQTGVLAYRQHGETQLTWYDRDGRRLQSIGPAGHFRNPVLSPDGKTIAVGRLDATRGTWDIWTIDVERQSMTPITTDPASEEMPVWSPDGAELAFKSDRTAVDFQIAVYRQRVGDAGAPAPFLNVRAPNITIHAWTSEGLIYSNSVFDVWRLTSAGQPVQLISTPFWTTFCQLAPSGKWMAYGTNETGVFEIYLSPVASPQRRTVVSTGGGTDPIWRNDGRELFYLSGRGQLMSVPISGSPDLHAGTPRVLFQPAVSSLINSWYTRNQYTVTGDGQRFLVNEPTGKGSLSAITVITNWPATLSRH